MREKDKNVIKDVSKGKIQEHARNAQFYVSRKPEILSEVWDFAFWDWKKNKKVKWKRIESSTMMRNKRWGAAALLGKMIYIIHVDFTFICNTDTHTCRCMNKWQPSKQELEQLRFPLISLLGSCMTCLWVNARVEAYLCVWHSPLPPDSHNSADLISQMNIAHCQKNWEM